MIKCLENKIRHLNKITYLVSEQKDGNQFYNAQVSYMSMVNESVIWYPYGMAANTPIDSFGITFNITGNQENQVTFPYSWDKRFTGLKSGEVIVGNPVKQTSIKFDEDGNITITSTGNVTIQGDLKVTGDIVASGDVSSDAGSLTMSDIQDKYNEHTHITNDDESDTPTPQI